ncbi:MAG: hypothetical protein DME25_17795 [Verrucomicrobia bacterium]|nr:MAG: hypothetical protein DME25_17795 [Verrucomicrobiota bacterium]
MKLNCSLRKIATSLLAAGAVLFSQTLSATTTETNLQKSFAVHPGGKLIVEADFGPIEITTADRPEVAITIKRSVSGASAARAQEIFADHEITGDQDGDTIVVRAKSKEKSPRWFRGGQNYQVQYAISVPKQFNLDLRTAAGAINCQDIEGAVKARSSGGNLKFAAVKGPLDASTSAGSINLVSASGPVSVKTSGGSLRLGDLGADTTAVTSAGSISVASAKGKLSAKTSGGSLDLGELAAPAEVETAAGSIHVRSSRAPLSARTSGGSIKIEDAQDTVVAHTSAGGVSAAFSGAPHDDCSLTTSGGSIEVKVADNLGFDVQAKTSGGRVSTDIPVATTVVGEHKAEALRGKLNGGGKALLLRTSAGNINIRRNGS